MQSFGKEVMINSLIIFVFTSSSPEVGSSSNRMCGRLIKARATAARCCCPPERAEGFLFPNSINPKSPNNSVILSFETREEIPAKDETIAKLLSKVARGNRLSC